MTTPRAVWGTFQGKYWLWSKKFIISGYTDMQRRRMVKWQNCWPNSTSSPQAPALLVDLGKVTFLLPILSPIPLFVHPSCLDWKMFSCDYVHIFVLESFCAKSKYVLWGIFLFFGKKKMKNSIFHSILSNACVGKKESTVFSWPKNQKMQIWGIW